MAPFDSDDAPLRGEAGLSGPAHLREVKATSRGVDPERLSTETEAGGKFQFTETIGHEVLGVAQKRLNPLAVLRKGAVMVEIASPG